MLTVQNDWIEYEEVERAAVRLQPVPARRIAVRGGATCAQRVPVVSGRRPSPLEPASPRAVVPRTVPVARTAAPVGRLRLTRRGRLVLVLLPSLLALSGALLVAAPGVAQAAAPRPAVRTVVVEPGDTLWGIAEHLEPAADPRVVVAAIERADGLADAQVHAGATLVLPAGR